MYWSETLQQTACRRTSQELGYIDAGAGCWQWYVSYQKLQVVDIAQRSAVLCWTSSPGMSSHCSRRLQLARSCAGVLCWELSIFAVDKAELLVINISSRIAWTAGCSTSCSHTHKHGDHHWDIHEFHLLLLVNCGLRSCIKKVLQRTLSTISLLNIVCGLRCSQACCMRCFSAGLDTQPCLES